MCQIGGPVVFPKDPGRGHGPGILKPDAEPQREKSWGNHGRALAKVEICGDHLKMC